MKVDKKIYKLRWTRGKLPGGQNMQKSENCCVLTHRETGIEVREDGRSRESNLKRAMRTMKDRLREHAAAKKAEAKKARRDAAIKDTKTVRTYNKSKNLVVDHRSGKKASWKDIVVKGQLDKLK